MIYQPLISGRVPYVAHLWECEDFTSHWHSEIEIIMCIRGRVEVAVEGMNHILKEWDILIIACEDEHQLSVREGGTLIMYLKFGYALLRSDFFELQDAEFCPQKYNLYAQETPAEFAVPLKNILELLMKEKNTLGKENAIRGNVYLISSYLLDHTIERKEYYGERQLRFKLFRNFREILNYVAEHYKENISVCKAAQIAGYEKTYFCKQFKRVIGMSFHKYLNYYRISRATLYLSDQNLSLNEIAENVGFSTTKLFCRLFKEYTGLRPTEYRKRYSSNYFVKQPQMRMGSNTSGKTGGVRFENN